MTSIRKKLIEVALPLEAINKASAREKSIRHGHPSTLHLWWARRPLAAARAVIFAQMVDDPSAHPDQFPTEEVQEKERQRLFRLIEELVLWENTTNETVLQAARDEIWKSWRVTCAENKDHPRAVELFNPDKLPAFHDPFAGGGSLPLEAQRLGLEAYASDLNPVAVLINKAMIEIPPKFAGRPPVNPGYRLQVTGNREKKENEDRVTSGSHRMAEGDGLGGADLSSDRPASDNRDLPSDLADHAGSSVSASKYRGRARPGNQEGLRSLSLDRQGLPHGDGDVLDARGATGLPERGASDTNTLSHHGDQQDADHPAQPTQHLTPVPSNLSPVPSSLFPVTYRGAQGLAEDVRYYGQWMRDEAEKRIGHLYPKVTGYRDEVTGKIYGDPSHAPVTCKLKPVPLTVIAWLWARTVKSPNPAFAQVDVPLASTFMLSTKPGKEAYVEVVIGDRSQETGDSPSNSVTSPLSPVTSPGYRFTVKMGKPKDVETAKNGTRLARGSFRCLMSDVPIRYEYIDDEANAGRMSERLMAVVAEGTRGRVYLPPSREMEAVARSAEPTWKPDAPSRGTWASNAQGRHYGFRTFGDYFTPRQLMALTTFSDLVQEARERVQRDAVAAGLTNDGKGLAAGGTGATSYADAVGVYLAFAVSKAADRNSSLCFWESPMNRLRGTFGRQAISMVWDYAETNPFAGAGGDIYGTAHSLCEVLDNFFSNTFACAEQQDASIQSLSADKVVSSDPPYYDNIGYADLSDFFYVWLRRSLQTVVPDLFATLAVPKAEELVACSYRHGSKEKANVFFLDGMTQAMHRLAEQTHLAFPVTIYYAFKQSESDGADGTASTGWETFIDAVIRAGFAVSGTWPMRTELTVALKKHIGVLASSIVLVCRPRQQDAPTVTRREFLTALKRELPVALAHLQHGNIAPVDLAQSAIGPGMAVFTRYAKVLDAEGKAMRVREALALINQTLDEVLAEQEGDFDADSRWALSWFEQYGFAEAEYGVAETLSKAKNTSVTGMVEAGILASKGGKVRLFKPAELPQDWNPATDPRLTAWEMVHQLIRTLETGGESAAAALVAKLGSKAEVARELCYRLYTLCERKKRAAEALSYNGLVQSWPEIVRLAHEGERPRAEQAIMFGENEE